MDGGQLDGHAAATHWLASPLLASYGSSTSQDRVVQVGNIITCEGQITAMHVALFVTLRLGGPEAVGDVREGLARAAPSRRHRVPPGGDAGSTNAVDARPAPRNRPTASSLLPT